MPIVNGYCTLAELRTWMSDTTSILPAAALEDAINATSRMIDNFCSRKFWRDPVAKTRRYKVTESDVAWVDDIADASTVIIKTDDLGDNSFSHQWSNTDWELGPYNSDVDDTMPYSFYRVHAVGNSSFPVNSFRRTLEVTAEFGWSAIPDGVKQACIMKSNMVVLRKDSPYGIAGFSEFGVVRISRTEDPEITRLLAPFIRTDVKAV